MSDHQNSKEYLAAYSSFSPYQYNKPHLYFANQNSTPHQNEPKQLQYNISNLPIIYDSNYRQVTPSKTSSRLVLEAKEPTLKEVNSSPVLKYQDPYQSKIYPDINNRSRQVFAQSRPQISPRIGIPTNQVLLPMPQTKKQQEYRHNPIEIQKNLNHHNIPFNISGHSQVYYKALSQVPANNNKYIASLPEQTGHQAQKNVPFLPVYTENYRNNNMVGQSQNNLTFNNLQANKQGAPREILIGKQNFSQFSTQTVPKIHYDKCVNQCKNWETKYNELYLKYMNLATKTSQINVEQVDELRKQNYELRMQLKQQSEKASKMVPRLQTKFIEMVNSQKEATIRECTLLVERLKLQLRQSKF